MADEEPAPDVDAGDKSPRSDAGGDKKAGGAAAGGMAGMKAKANSALDDLDDHLPPSLRTAKQIAKKLGTNKAARMACMALAGGERLTKVQKKALFKMGLKDKINTEAMIAMLKQSDGLGVTPMELDMMRAEGIKKQLPKQLLTGFGWMAGENAGPGTMSVILEAQARLCGLASAVDSDEAEVASVRVLRQMVFGQSIRPLDMAEMLCTVFGTLDGTKSNDNASEKFWLRFSKDCLASPDSNESIMLQQLMLGRGVGEWSSCKLPIEEQGKVLIKLIERIERGAPPVTKPPPSKEAIAAGGALMADAFADSDIDENETKMIFRDYDLDHGGSLDMEELTKVVISIIKTARKSAVEKVSLLVLLGVDFTSFTSRLLGYHPFTTHLFHPFVLTRDYTNPSVSHGTVRILASCFLRRSPACLPACSPPLCRAFRLLVLTRTLPALYPPSRYSVHRYRPLLRSSSVM